MFLSYLIVSMSILAIVAKLKNRKNYISNNRSKTSLNSSRNQLQNCSLIEKFECNAPPLEPNNTRKISEDSYNKRLGLINNKMYDTKILSSISISFVLFNTPYFIFMLYVFVYGMKLGDLNRFSVPDLFIKLKVQSYIVLTEILQLLNFSVTGLLFFGSGQVFRFHALQCLRKMISCCLK